MLDHAKHSKHFHMRGSCEDGEGPPNILSAELVMFISGVRLSEFLVIFDVAREVIIPCSHINLNPSPNPNPNPNQRFICHVLTLMD